MKRYTGLAFLVISLVACNVPKPSKCSSTIPGVIAVQDNFTGECVDIQSSKIRVVLEQGTHTYIELMGGDNYKVVEDYDVVVQKRKAAYGRWE